MNRPEPDSPAARQRAATAAEWLVKHDRGFTAAEQDEFLQWLSADARHGEWFALHRRTVGDFNCLAQWRPEHSEEPNPDLLAPPRSAWRRAAPLALAAGLAVTFVWWWSGSTEPDAGAAFAGAYERRILEDGSAVELNRGAVVNVTFSATERRVVLERGEALFSVMTQPGRPFIVRAAGIDVRAIGTVFNVRLDPTTVEVLVTEGRVRLAQIAAPVIGPPSHGAQNSRVDLPTPTGNHLAPELPEIAAGHRATVSLDRAAPPRIVPVSAEESTRLLAWQPRLLDFSSAPLSRAVEEFNRRNRVQFILADSELGAMPVVASVRSDNVAGFARILAATPGLEIEHRGENQIIVRRKK